MNGSTESGVLYLVSTPIGNLEDITLRALRTLKEVTFIAAEDTRRTGKLLKHFDIQNRLESYHDHNKKGKTPKFIHQLSKGDSIAVVTDAGTPGISDPAFYLVREAVKQKINVISVPGATAALTALTVSGLPTDRFVFEGFLPTKKGRKKRLGSLAQEHRTIILYEAPHRLLRTLTDLDTFLEERDIAICRELTKKFEEVTRGSIKEMISEFSQRKILGEFVLIIKGKEKKKL